VPPKTSNRRCTVCGSRLKLLPVLYGYPTPEAFERAERGELVIGGCIPGGPSGVCAVCHEPENELRLPAVDPDRPPDADAVEASRALGVRHAKGRLAAAIWGHLVGDAIGVPYEFSQHIETVELRGNGTHNQPLGTWSDDGALMLALLDSLVTVGFDPEDQGGRALAWADVGAYTPDADGRFDIGGATSAALDRLRRGVPAIDAGGTGDRDQGNGSLMRILPIALIDVPRDDAELVERAHLASRVTHGHPNCQVACALYVLIVRELLRGAAVPETALEAAVERLRGVYSGDPAFGSVLEALLARRSNLRKPGGGWVLDSFWSAWEAFAQGSSYRDTIERAVKYGNDTDTTAAIAGGLAGIRWGLNERTGGIPFPWLVTLRGKDVVGGLLTKLPS
jgi:ADP-ribosyl-[dinitrogen reductase] hydrolase